MLVTSFSGPSCFGDLGDLGAGEKLAAGQPEDVSVAPDLLRRNGQAVSIDYIREHCKFRFPASESPITQQECIQHHLSGKTTPFQPTIPIPSSNPIVTLPGGGTAVVKPPSETPFFKKPLFWLAVGGGLLGGAVILKAVRR